METKADIQAAVEACSEVEEETYITKDKIDKILSKRNIISTIVRTTS